MIRIIRERGSFVASATNRPDVAKKILSIQKTVRMGRFVKSVGESIQNMVYNAELTFVGTNFAVRVDSKKRSRPKTERGKVWVKSASHPFYVGINERGIFETKEEAERAKTETWEMIVNV